MTRLHVSHAATRVQALDQMLLVIELGVRSPVDLPALNEAEARAAREGGDDDDDGDGAALLPAFRDAAKLWLLRCSKMKTNMANRELLK